MKLKKIISFAISLTLVLQLVSAMTVNTYAAAYDYVGSYSVNPNETTEARTQSVVATTIGGKMYSYSASASGVVVYDITNPVSPVQVEYRTNITVSSGWTNSGERMYIKDDCLFVINKATENMEVYRIDEATGKLSENYIYSAINTGKVYNGYGTIKVVGDILFLAGFNRDESVQLFNISNPASPVKLTTTTPIKATMGYLATNNTAIKTSNSTETKLSEDALKEQGIAAYGADVYDMGNGKYRIFSNNRVNFNVNGNVYFLAINDITVAADGTYTVETKYEGQVAGTVFANNAHPTDMQALDANTLVITAENNGVKVIDLTDVANPKMVAATDSSSAVRRPQSIYLDGQDIIVSDMDYWIEILRYEDGKLNVIRHFRPAGNIRYYEATVYSGFILTAGWGKSQIFEYKKRY